MRGHILVRIAMVAILLSLLACTQEPPSGSAPTSVPTPAPSPAASPAPTVIAVADVVGSITTLRLITLDGQDLAHLDLPQGATVEGAGGDMATFVQSDGTLRGLRENGSIVALGSVKGVYGPVVVRPDGGAWMWAAGASSGGALTTRAILSSPGAADRTLAQQSTTQPRALQPFRWTPGGAVYVNDADGLGGYYPYSFASGASWKVDAQSGQPVALLDNSCYVADLAADGSTACWPAASGFANHPTIRIQLAGGQSKDVSLPAPVFRFSGAVSFRPGSPASTLAIGGATGQGAGTPDGSNEHYQVDLINAATGAMTAFGPAGLRPADGSWAWLPDGSLLAYRPAGAYGGDPGIYAIAQNGSARLVYASGTPVGVLTHQPASGIPGV